MPVLATHISCHTDVIGNDEFVFWAKDASVDGLFQALCKIWNAKQLLPQMGSSAAAASQKWTYRSSAEKLKKALEKGIERNFLETQGLLF